MSEYDALLEPPKQASKYDALLTPVSSPNQASPYDALLSPSDSITPKSIPDSVDDGTEGEYPYPKVGDILPSSAPAEPTAPEDYDPDAARFIAELENPTYNNTKIRPEYYSPGEGKSTYSKVLDQGGSISGTIDEDTGKLNQQVQSRGTPDKDYRAEAQRPMVEIIPPPSPTFQANNPQMGAVYGTVADFVNSFTSKESLGILGVTGGSGKLVQKLVALGFAGYSAKNVVDDLSKLRGVSDPVMRTKIITDAILQAGVGALAAHGGLSKGGTLTTDGRLAIRRADPAVLERAIQDVKFPKDWKTAIQQEIATRKKASLVATAESIQKVAPLTAKVLRQTEPATPEIPAEGGEVTNENQSNANRNGKEQSSPGEQPAVQTDLQNTEARQSQPDQRESGKSDQVLGATKESEVIPNEIQSKNEGKEENANEEKEVVEEGGSTPPSQNPNENTQAAQESVETPVAENPQLAEKPAEQTGAKGSEVGKQAVNRPRIIAQDGEIPTPVVDNPKLPHIVSTALQTDEGIFTGKKTNTAHDAVAVGHDVESIPDQKGFLVNDGKGNLRFVGREEAGVIADSSGQRLPETEGKPLQSQDLKEPNTTGIKNSIVDTERSNKGLPEREAVAKRTFGSILEEAKETLSKDHKAGGNLVDSLQKKMRSLTDSEDALLTVEQITRQNEYDQAVNDVNNAKTDAERAEAEARLSRARDSVYEIYDIGTQAGTANGRGLNARRLLVKQDYSLARMEARKRAANGGETLTKAQSDEVKALHDKLADQSKRIEEFESSQKDTVAKDYFDQLIKETRKQATEAKKSGAHLTDFLQEQANRARQRIRSRGVTLNAGLNPAQLIDHAIIGADLIAKGTVKFAEWSGGMVKEFGEKIKPYLEDLFDRSKSYHEASSKLFEDKSVLTREQILSKAKTESELDHKTVFDLARAHVNEGVQGFDNVMKAVFKDLQPIHEGLKERDVRDAFSGYGEVRYPSKEADLTTLREYRRLGQLVSAIEDANKGEVPKKSGTQRDKPTQNIREKMTELQSAMEKNGIETKSPDEQLASKNQARATALKNQIEDLDKQLKTGEKQANGNPVPDSTEVESLKSERDAMKAELKEIEDKANPPKSPDEVRLERYKKMIQKRTNDLNQKIASGDYTKNPQTKTILDEDAMKLKADYERSKLEFECGIMKDKLSKRKTTEKILDALPKWSRAFLLSNPVTIAKLTAAAAWRMAITPVEEAVGGVLSKIPGISKVASRAPREGGFSVAAEAKAITDAIMKGSKDAYDMVVKRGDSELHMLSGKNSVMPKELFDFLGELHGALKAPTKRAEFSRSLQKRIEFNIKNGVDVSDPLVQTRMISEAVKDSDRSIFMQDNRLVSRYQRFVHSLGEADKTTGKVPIGSKILQSGLKTLLPIVRVPTNIVAEAFQYVAGGVIGSGRLVNALRKGVENLPEAHADLIMRELKKGSVGGSLILLGYLAHQYIGGYYQKGEKQPDVKHGSLKVFGHEIPSYLLHNPAMEMLQFGATIRKVSDEKAKGIPAGTMAALLGLVEQVPFVREQTEINKLFGSDKERSQFLGELAKSRLEPALIQKIAEFTDKDKSGENIQRSPEGIGQYLESGIPGLRKNVPEKGSGKKSPYALKQTKRK